MASLDDSGSRSFNDIHNQLLHCTPSAASQINHRSYPRTAPARQVIEDDNAEAPELNASVLRDSEAGQPPGNAKSVLSPHRLSQADIHDAAAEDYGGDTQLMPSQIYKDYQSRVEDLDDIARHDESGHVDLLNGFSQDESQQVTQVKATVDGGSNPDSGDTQGSLLSSVARQQYLPTTPAIANEKRGRLKNPASPRHATHTPGSGLSNILGTTKKPRIPHSQLYSMTQRQSSPAQQDPRSDPGDTRPSPDFVHSAALTTSPSWVFKRAASSPIKTGEPIERYTSMDESQRKRFLSHDDPRNDGRVSTRVIFDTDDSLYGDHGQARTLPTDRLARHQSTPINNSVARYMHDATEPLKSPAKSVIAISDDGMSSPVDSIDEYDEFSEAVIRSQRPETIDNASPCPSSHTSTQQNAEGPEASASGISQQRLETDLVVLDSQPPLMPAVAAVVSQHRDDSVSASGGLETTSESSSRLQNGSQAARARASDEIQSTPPVPESSHHVAASSRIRQLAKDVEPLDPEAMGQLKKGASLDGSSVNDGAVNNPLDTEQNAATCYETAKSQMSRHELTPQSSYDSPRKAAGVPRMTDITDDPPPFDASKTSMNSGILQDIELFTKDDQDFLDLVQTVPSATKRTIGYGKRRRGAAADKETRPSSPREQETNQNPECQVDVDNAGGHAAARTITADERLQETPDIEMTVSERNTTEERASSPAKRKRDEVAPCHADKAAQKRVKTQDSVKQHAHAEEISESKERIDRASVEPSRIALPDPSATSASVPATAETLSRSIQHPSTWAPLYRHRVLAPFRGTIVGIFPATCTSMMDTVDGGKCVVKFDDGNEAKLEPHLVGAFELREGDLVKVDEPQSRSKRFKVLGLVKNDASSDLPICTDVHGNTHVKLIPRARASLANHDTCEDESRIVSLARVYLTSTMWKEYSDRTYEVIGHLVDIKPTFRPPSHVSSTQPTPRGKARRDTLDNAHSFPVIPPSAVKGGMFAQMAFALTFEETDKQKDLKQRTIGAIASNGGRIIDGFNGLFEPSETAGLNLTESASTLGFVALITDKHSRREKYIQALALGLPCLSHLWITASVKAGHPLDWGRYLLPAGESKLLDTIHSRVLLARPVVEVQLSQTIAQRERLLEKGGVLIIPPKKDKDKEKGAIFSFLAFAVGAERVSVVANLEEAAELLMAEPDQWDWVHYEDSEQEVLHTYLHAWTSKSGRTKAGGGTLKSKLGAVISRGELGMSARTEKCRFVTKEFVVQSIILGSLVEE